MPVCFYLGQEGFPCAAFACMHVQFKRRELAAFAFRYVYLVLIRIGFYCFYSVFVSMDYNYNSPNSRL